MQLEGGDKSERGMIEVGVITGSFVSPGLSRPARLFPRLPLDPTLMARLAVLTLSPIFNLLKVLQFLLISFFSGDLRYYLEFSF